MKCINCAYFLNCDNASEKLKQCGRYISKREYRELEEYAEEIKKIMRSKDEQKE